MGLNTNIINMNYILIQDVMLWALEGLVSEDMYLNSALSLTFSQSFIKPTFTEILVSLC